MAPRVINVSNANTTRHKNTDTMESVFPDFVVEYPEASIDPFCMARKS